MTPQHPAAFYPGLFSSVGDLRWERNSQDALTIATAITDLTAPATTVHSGSITREPSLVAATTTTTTTTTATAAATAAARHGAVTQSIVASTVISLQTLPRGRSPHPYSMIV